MLSASEIWDKVMMLRLRGFSATEVRHPFGPYEFTAHLNRPSGTVLSVTLHMDNEDFTLYLTPFSLLRDQPRPISERLAWSAQVPSDEKLTKLRLYI